VWAIAQAGRGRILAACYGRVDGAWSPLGEPSLTTVADLAAKIDQPALCTGEIDHQAAQVLQRDSKARVVPPADRLRRASYLAEIAAARLAAGLQDDPDALAPIYLSTP
jgi:tRNA A37 threonylcarbamoyladenosine modification protein TsaB